MQATTLMSCYMHLYEFKVFFQMVSSSNGYNYIKMASRVDRGVQLVDYVPGRAIHFGPNGFGTFSVIAQDITISTTRIATQSSDDADKPRNMFRGQSRSPNMVPFRM